MLEHGWDKHVVAFLQVLAQKHGAGVNVGGSSSTLLDVEMVETELAVHLYLEMRQDKILHPTRITVFVLGDPRSSVFFILGPIFIPLPAVTLSLFSLLHMPNLTLKSSKPMM